MAYYLDIFSPATYEGFSNSDRSMTGVRLRQKHAAERIQPGDKLICYLTKLSRWIGVLEVLSESFIDETPRFSEIDDPYVVRLRVRPVVWLPKEKAMPIREDHVWNRLSFTREHEKTGSTWTGKFRSSLTALDDADGKFLEELICSQAENGQVYPVDENEYRKYLTQRVHRVDRLVSVSVPEDDTLTEPAEPQTDLVRDSIHIQALLARIGERMGYRIWLPKSDRSRVLQQWEPISGVLMDLLPLNYDTVTLKTIEQIDVLWLKNRAIVRAYEIEHTTAVYSGLLRMADLLALQPNMDIKLHIVAPAERRDKVFEEIQRPVFSLLERSPLSEICTFLTYDSIKELADNKYLSHLSDSVLEEYEEIAE